jgi:hypothetical protein
MSTLEGIVTTVVVVASLIGIAVAVLVRRAARRIPSELDPRYDDPAGR